MITSDEIRQAREEILAEGFPDAEIDPELLHALVVSVLFTGAIVGDPVQSACFQGVKMAMTMGYRIGRKQMLAELTKVQE